VTTSPHRAAQRRPSRIKGIALICFGLVMFAGAIAAMFALRLSGALGGALISAVGGFSALLIYRGRRHLARSGEAALRSDRRPPILFLRQFSDDGALHGLSFWRSRRLLSLRSWYVRTYEQRVARAVRGLGPLVAIGRPDEELPELGAARIYVGDDAWQVKVGELVVRSQLVLLQIGDTEGIRWEIETLVGKVPPAKLILCLPLDEKTGESAQENRYKNSATSTPPSFPSSSRRRLVARSSFISRTIGLPSYWSQGRQAATSYRP